MIVFFGRFECHLGEHLKRRLEVWVLLSYCLSFILLFLHSPTMSSLSLLAGCCADGGGWDCVGLLSFFQTIDKNALFCLVGSYPFLLLTIVLSKPGGVFLNSMVFWKIGFWH